MGWYILNGTKKGDKEGEYTIKKERGNGNRLCNSQSGRMGMDRTNEDRSKSGVGPPTDRGVAKKQNREGKDKGYREEVIEKKLDGRGKARVHR